MTSRQTQIRIAGSVLLIASLIFLGTIALDRTLYSHYSSGASSYSPSGTDSSAATMDASFFLGDPVVRTASYKTSAVPQPTMTEADEAEYALDPDKHEEELLWLARCILSETKRKNEMHLVGWVVRNRVDTKYRGKSTYKSVVLDPFQFSAFNPGHPKRSFYSNLTLSDKTPGWRNALEVAGTILASTAHQRPFDSRTRHFYSEQSMAERSEPAWVGGKQAVDVQEYNIPAERFRFFRDVI